MYKHIAYYTTLVLFNNHMNQIKVYIFNMVQRSEAIRLVFEANIITDYKMKGIC